MLCVKQTDEECWVVVLTKPIQEHLTWKLSFMKIKLCNSEDQHNIANCSLCEYDISAFYNHFSFDKDFSFSFYSVFSKRLSF